VLVRVLETLNIDSRHFTPERIAAVISHAKNQLVAPERFAPRPGQPVEAVVADVYPEYQKRLLASAAVDFDDLLFFVARLLRENPDMRGELDERYRYILVDEYQDTNLAQYAIVRALSIEQQNLAVTGDPDQSIYGWRGANIGNILKFEQDFPSAHVVRLEQNYRSTKSILRIADELIRRNKRRKEKDLYTQNEQGPPVRLVRYLTQNEEAESIAAHIALQLHEGKRRARDFAIFYRVNALSRTLEEALRTRGIAYQIINGLEFYQRKEVKDVLAYLSLINNPRDDVAALRIINTPPRGIGRTTIGHLRDHAERYGLCMLDAVRECKLIEALTSRAQKELQKFWELQDSLRELALAPLEEILGHVLAASGYAAYLSESDLEEDRARLENIQELLTDAKQFDQQHPEPGALEAFLERASLVSDTDEMETESDKVTLMTLHAAKGLEFSCVFIVAVEDGLIPHERSRDDFDQMEEERRLLFVGITRAMQELQLSQVSVREFRGQRRQAIPSSFLMELPRAEMDVLETFYQPPYAAEYASAPTPRKRRSESETPAGANVVTAAELSGEASKQAEPDAPQYSPDDFHHGMAVIHPVYQLGKIVALSGSGPRRTATVAFATAGQKKFVLSSSKLRPAARAK